VSARARRAIVAASLAWGVVASVGGCREIAGVPSASSLRDISDPPPLCECGWLLDQGEAVTDACRAAYESLPDLGEGDAAVPFGSKEELLASESCGACRPNDPGVVSTCWVELLGSAGRPGAIGTSCEGPGDCHSWACCADVDLSGGSCCDSCIGCDAYLAGSSGGMCADAVSIYVSLVECVCAEIEGAIPVGCLTQCPGGCTDPSRECVDCLLGSVGPACASTEQACLGAGSRPKPRSNQ
jgi:hypothetical protein